MNFWGGSLLACMAMAFSFCLKEALHSYVERMALSHLPRWHWCLALARASSLGEVFLWGLLTVVFLQGAVVLWVWGPAVLLRPEGWEIFLGVWVGGTLLLFGLCLFWLKMERGRLNAGQWLPEQA